MYHGGVSELLPHTEVRSIDETVRLPLGKWGHRLLQAPAFYLAVAIAGLAVGRMLTPDPRGLGTHEALGLPPCTFQYITGFPCPGCGMTTAVSHAAHGHFLVSLRTQPAGFLFAVGLALAIPLMAYAWVRGLPAAAVLPRAPRHRLGWGVVLFPVLFLAWGYKLIVVAFFT